MGTLFEVLLRGDDEEHLAAVADATLDEIQRIEQLLSRFDPRSEMSRINRLAASEEVLVDHEVAGVLKTCLDAREWTRGAFDITAPSRRVAAAVKPGGHAGRGIDFDSDRRIIRFTSPQVQLDLGGIGKGYALDRAAELLDEHGIEHALFHGGTSSVLARGTAEDGEPWKIVLRHPLTGEEAGIQRLKNEALSCSAVNDQADIIDSATGEPVTGTTGVAVIAQSATEAEVLSTALLCVGRVTGERLVLLRGGFYTTAIWL